MIRPPLEVIVDQMTRRVQDLELRLSQHFSHREPSVARYIQTRLAITCEDSGVGSGVDTYPPDPRMDGTGSAEPNVFPIRFYDSTFPLTAGLQVPTTLNRTVGKATHALNLTGDYVPLGTHVLARQIQGLDNTYPGEWFIERILLPAPIWFELTEAPSFAGGLTGVEVTAVHGYGPEVGAEIDVYFPPGMFQLTQTGAVGRATWDDTNARYEVEIVDQWTRRARAVLADDLCSVNPVEVSDFEALDDWPYSLVPTSMASGGEVTNPYNSRGTGPSSAGAASNVLLGLDAGIGSYFIEVVYKSEISPAGLVGLSEDQGALQQLVHTIVAERCTAPVLTQGIEATAECDGEV